MIRSLFTIRNYATKLASPPKEKVVQATANKSNLKIKLMAAPQQKINATGQQPKSNVKSEAVQLQKKQQPNGNVKNAAGQQQKIHVKNEAHQKANVKSAAKDNVRNQVGQAPTGNAAVQERKNNVEHPKTKEQSKDRPKMKNSSEPPKGKSTSSNSSGSGTTVNSAM